MREELEPKRSLLDRLKSIPAGKLGHTAASSDVEVVLYDEYEGEENSAESLFGLEDSLVEYAESQGELNKFIRRASQDAGGKQIMTEAIESVYSPPKDTARGNRRFVRQVADRDFQELVLAYANAGRFMAVAASAAYDEKDGHGFMGNFKEFISTIRTLERKKRGLLGTIKNTEQMANLKSLLGGIEDRAQDKYGDIYEREVDILNALWQRAALPAEAAKIMEAYTSIGESESQVDNAFASLLANEHFLYPNSSVIARSLQVLNEAYASGQNSDEFIGLMLDDDQSQFRYWQSVIEQVSPGIDFNKLMRSRFDSWPPAIKSEYEKFSSGKMGEIRGKTAAANRRHTRRSWMLPTIDEHERLLDRVFHQLHPGGYQDVNLR